MLSIKKRGFHLFNGSSNFRSVVILLQVDIRPDQITPYNQASVSPSTVKTHFSTDSDINSVGDILINATETPRDYLENAILFLDANQQRSN